jgi:pimeloyl-ACP methyl ester carboxylesterase
MSARTDRSRTADRPRARFLCSTRWFDRLTPLLSDRFRVIRADLLGHGFSTKPDRATSRRTRRVCSAHCFRSSGVADPVVVGHSLGADLAIALIEHGVGVSRLVVVDEAPDYTVAIPSSRNRVLRLPVLGRLLFDRLPTSALRQAIEGFLAPGRSLDSTFDDTSAAIDDVRAVPYACFLSTQVEKERFVAERPLDARISAAGVATLVVFGERDLIFRCRESCERYRAVPGVRAEVLADAGHSPVVEDPSRTAELIADFIAA